MAPQESADTRHFTRIVFDSDATLRGADGKRAAVKMLDISLHGTLLERPADWQSQPGEEVTVEIALGGGSVIITMVGTIAHTDHGHLGVECKHLDLESATHLRRLVELNLGDDSLLQREISELVAVMRKSHPQA